MIPHRWTLRRYSKLLAVGAALCWFAAEALERANWQAQQAAEDSIHWHELNEHQEELEVAEEGDG